MYKRLKLKLKVFSAGYSVAMATYCVTKIIPTCSPVIRRFFDAMNVAPIDKSKSWNVLETVLSHLKRLYFKNVKVKFFVMVEF